jgi:plasmid stabilization system protein ParE
VTSDYRLTPAAQAGYLRVVIDAEAQFDAALALRVELGIERAFEQLARMPRSGHLRPDLTHDVTMRFWSVGPTLIAYRTWQDAIEVVLVARAERDWGHMLEEQEEEA